MTPTAETGATEFLANLTVGMVVVVAVILTVLRLGLLGFKTMVPTTGKSETVPAARAIAEVLESLIVAGILVFLIIRPFFIQAFFIPSESMENTLQGHDADGTKGAVHDHIFVSKLAYRLHEPERGDIIVFKAPLNADSENPSKGLPPQENVLIKRLIGIPGDTIEVKEETSPDGNTVAYVYRNGVKLNEPYTKEPMGPQGVNGASWAEENGKGPLKLGPGQLFVMGDNRNNSNDSRFWGILERSRVIGKASFIFLPLNRIRVLH